MAMNEVSRRTEGELKIQLGCQVRSFRKDLGVSLSELSKMSGLSTGMLSKLENGLTSASLATLLRLAEALNIPIASFFAEFDEKREATYVRSGQGLTIERRGSSKGHLYQLLGHSLRSKTSVEPFLITLGEDSDAYPIFKHPGIEFIYMLSGKVTYRHGSRTYQLTPGDSLFFDSDTFHGPLELKQIPAVFLCVMVNCENS